METFHFPPELFNLLVDTIPLLNKSKEDVFIFFKGAGTPYYVYETIHKQWEKDPSSVNKYQITRHIVSFLNNNLETYLQQRREILKRVTEFDNFSCCWDNDRLKAKGLVSEIRSTVNMKDSFTRMRIAEEKSRRANIEKYEKEVQSKIQKKAKIEAIKSSLFALFHENNSSSRGIKLESILNSLFDAYGILIREAFTVKGQSGEGIIEQIDGAIEQKGHIYFIEMKWWKAPIGKPEISEHLIRIYHRAEARAIIISASSFTTPAVSLVQEALQQKVVILFSLHEIIQILENERDLALAIEKKAHAAILDKNPIFTDY